MKDKQPAEASIGNVTGWLHSKGLSTAAAGIYQLEKKRGLARGCQERDDRMLLYQPARDRGHDAN